MNGKFNGNPASLNHGSAMRKTYLPLVVVMTSRTISPNSTGRPRCARIMGGPSNRAEAQQPMRTEAKKRCSLSSVVMFNAATPGNDDGRRTLTMPASVAPSSAEWCDRKVGSSNKKSAGNTRRPKRSFRASFARAVHGNTRKSSKTDEKKKSCHLRRNQEARRGEYSRMLSGDLDVRIDRTSSNPILSPSIQSTLLKRRALSESTRIGNCSSNQN
mmetsp:Transcript_17803/g.50451  ORF Transcript_17803/g.50451 Transcript_17803/m.50451 type:complete len:215 (+) Transcript_17803:330-974(+)